MTDFSTKIATELNLNIHHVAKAIALLRDGNSIPFIARYRKEATNSMDEVQLTDILNKLKSLEDLEKRKKTVIDSITEQGKITEEILQKIASIDDINALEDLYLPYKPKRKTRASMAIEKGLSPLAEIIFKEHDVNIETIAAQYVNPKKEVHNAEEALSGAQDIIAEWINENADIRAKMRKLFIKEAVVFSKIIKKKSEEAIKYTQYFDYQEPISKVPPHRLLAMIRGENEEFLTISIKPDEENAVFLLKKYFVKKHNSCSAILTKAIGDSYKRLLQPSIETEVKKYYKEQADIASIKFFALNLQQLLMFPPLKEMNVLAIDPGFRTGCKVVCLDKFGQLLNNTTIYPHSSLHQKTEAEKIIINIIGTYNIQAIAIGNGTAGRETDAFIRSLGIDKDIKIVTVNESGASIYSASESARKEFPDYDITVRGAVSIGRRLIDPLAELVKIDPKSIGVGQYQHDVDQHLLKDSLNDVVVSCVNNVGVDLNIASKELLSYVSGLNEKTAENIVTYRNKNGIFKSRNDLRNISRFGEKTFEQSAGFLRIQEAENPLDNSAVHPESYAIVGKMAKSLNCSVKELINNNTLLSQINLQNFITENVGLPTLRDIVEELKKPGRDPRTNFESIELNPNITKMEDLHVGMILQGIVTNITAFGAFADIGVHQDGLIHVSQMSTKFIKDPNEVVKLNQKVNVKLLDIDISRKRISLSMLI